MIPLDFLFSAHPKKGATVAEWSWHQAGSEGSGFKPLRLQATFDPGLLKK